jgi:hypothetical protein
MAAGGRCNGMEPISDGSLERPVAPIARPCRAARGAARLTRSAHNDEAVQPTVRAAEIRHRRSGQLDADARRTQPLRPNRDADGQSGTRRGGPPKRPIRAWGGAITRPPSAHRAVCPHGSARLRRLAVSARRPPRSAGGGFTAHRPQTPARRLPSCDRGLSGRRRRSRRPGHRGPCGRRGRRRRGRPARWRAVRRAG